MPVGGRREIQVGTITTTGDVPEQQFRDIKSLPLDKLSSLKGIDFWIAAYNGAQVFCGTTIGYPTPCELSDSGRPVLID